MRIYLASSWRNPYQPDAVGMLRAAGHSVYDFQHPEGGDHLGFSWDTVDRSWRTWGDPGRRDGFAAYRAGIEHPVAIAGYDSDMAALEGADATVLLLPCNRSAHLELGYAVGREQRTAVWIPSDADFGEYGDRGAGWSRAIDVEGAFRADFEPELMYRMVGLITDDVHELVGWLRS